jgi:DNA polymerase elongation subunit (family B)
MKFYTNVALMGNNILVREYDNGTRKNMRVPYEPTLFVPSNKQSKFKTLEGRMVSPVKQGSINDARDFLRQYDNVAGFEIYGNTNYQYCYVADEYPGMIDYDMSQLVIANFDIETGSDNGFPQPDTALEPVISITIKTQGVYHVLGYGDYTPHQDDVNWIKCRDEADLLLRFLDLWDEIQPDIMTGWNIQFFDIPYLVNRIERILGSDMVRKLSPWGKVGTRQTVMNGRDQTIYDLIGIGTLDYYELYRKFAPVSNHESYRLDYIANYELGTGKLDYSEYGSLHTLYKSNYQLFIEYNVKDVDLVDQLENKMKLLEMAVSLAYDAKVNYQDVYAQVRMWDTLIFNDFKQKKIVMPSKKKAEKSASYSGAYVKEPIVGMHEWVMSFDLNSLYPHLIMQYNISPETLLDGRHMQVDVDGLLEQNFDLTSLQSENATVTPNGVMFDKSQQGFLPAMMERMYNDRKKYKKMMLQELDKAEREHDPAKKAEYKRLASAYNNTQLAKKVQLNSAYGALGNQYFRFYDLRMAEAITYGGQLSIRWIANDVNKWLNNMLKTDGEDYVVASDTDSIYVRFGGLVNQVFKKRSDIPGDDTLKIVQFLDRAAEEKIEPFIDKSYQNLATYVNAYAQKMQMKREAIADKAIWQAKKRYILNVWDNEGVRYEKAKLKMSGIEAVKSSTPTVCRDRIKHALELIMTANEKTIQNYVANFKEEFFELPLNDIAFPRGCNGVKKYSDSTSVYIKGTPMHVKGAIVYNKLLRDNKLTKKYQIVQEGDKIKFLYMREPNPSTVGCISFPSDGTLPEEFLLTKYVNKDEQFAKSFVEPLDAILNVIGWNAEQKASLEDLFI